MLRALGTHAPGVLGEDALPEPPLVPPVVPACASARPLMLIALRPSRRGYDRAPRRRAGRPRTVTGHRQPPLERVPLDAPLASCLHFARRPEARPSGSPPRGAWVHPGGIPGSGNPAGDRGIGRPPTEPHGHCGAPTPAAGNGDHPRMCTPRGRRASAAAANSETTTLFLARVDVLEMLAQVTLGVTTGHANRRVASRHPRHTTAPGLSDPQAECHAPRSPAEHG